MNKDIEELIKYIKKKFGNDSIATLEEKKSVDFQSTGILSIDMILNGGLPKGRVIEIFGPESSGKTTLALHAIAERQRNGEICAFIDVEHALDRDYAKRIGINMKELLISQPNCGEEALDLLDNLVRSGKVSVVVIDSVAALTPKAEIEGEMGQQQIGLQARLMSKALRKLSGIISSTNTVVIFLNQIRMKINAYGNPETTSGGLALKFFSSVRMDLRKIAKIKSKEEFIGSRHRAKIVKNKVGSPFKVTEFDIYYTEGISKIVDTINVGILYEVVQKAGSWFYFGEEKLGQGIEGVKKFLNENPKIIKQISAEINKKVL